MNPTLILPAIVMVVAGALGYSALVKFCKIAFSLEDEDIERDGEQSTRIRHEAGL